MRLPVDAAWRCLALGLTAFALSGCGLVGGERSPVIAPAATEGPAADFPMVLGDPFVINGVTYTPDDTLNYDMVGFAAADDGAGITAAHRTLPLPSYAEVTSLDSGKTILVRVERRGPLAGDDLVALSPAAREQLGIAQNAAVRVRRVNPIEAERAELRAGRSVPERLETPKSLVEVLRRKLPAAGSASLREPGLPAAEVATVKPRIEGVPVAQSAAVEPVPAAASLESAVKPASAQPLDANGFMIQAGAFASQDNARRAAKALGGNISPSGKLFLVRTGPFASRGQAAAALAKVRAAGYTDARVITPS
jgi:rare lipoprotein A